MKVIFNTYRLQAMRTWLQHNTGKFTPHSRALLAKMANVNAASLYRFINAESELSYSNAEKLFSAMEKIGYREESA